ncbi:hypothetical protein GCM10011611_54520 [Aliidongia dinghuensis]|uniref:Uncharacterized protein n=1 Tax=Aliidongia dinghuensis TaxID=1867774 RepID=A0A8J2Z0V5_9PROT|nr:hypothetical protein GCM10011611_54520 [Aliidongia dinghuensis]
MGALAADRTKACGKLLHRGMGRLTYIAGAAGTNLFRHSRAGGNPGVPQRLADISRLALGPRLRGDDGKKPYPCR